MLLSGRVNLSHHKWKLDCYVWMARLTQGDIPIASVGMDNFGKGISEPEGELRQVEPEEVDEDSKPRK